MRNEWGAVFTGLRCKSIFAPFVRRPLRCPFNGDRNHELVIPLDTKMESVAMDAL
jgi:hypothetical protein